MARIREDFPISTRLLREVHGVLLGRGRGSERQPREFRRSQNWIGGSRPGNAGFIPPPHEDVATCMGQLENFIHDTDQRTPTLIKAALSHVQFETIHPFLDGNGRVGRLLITLLLCEERAIEQPLLYLSFYFKQNRAQYYELLTRVCREGDWKAWLTFFLEGVRATSEQAARAARRILQRFEQDRRAIESLGRAAGTALRIHSILQKRPILSISGPASTLGLAFPTVAAAFAKLEALGIINTAPERQRDRRFVYGEYLLILNEGTELP